MSVVFSGEQIRAARALARIDQIELARQCGLSVETIKRLERIRGPIDANIRTLRAINDAFRRMGIAFEMRGEGATGVWLTSSVDDVASVCAPVSYIGARRAQPLHRLIYFSEAAAMPERALEFALGEIVAASRSRNRALDVNSVLLASEGRFLQALEGGKEAVLQVYGAICTDRRHSKLHVAESAPIASRRFADIDMCARWLNPRDPLLGRLSGGAALFEPASMSTAAALDLLDQVTQIVDSREGALRA